MAIGLLKDPPEKHMYRHDLESIYYCILDMSYSYIRHALTAKLVPALWQWRELSIWSLADSKSLCLLTWPNSMSTGKGYVSCKFEGGFNIMQYWVIAMRRMFNQAYSATSSYEDTRLLMDIGEPELKFDPETCDDIITFDKFEALLAK
jgi:hypothetical protein